MTTRAPLLLIAALALAGCMKPNPLAELAQQAEDGLGDGDGDGDPDDGEPDDGDPGEPGDGDPGDPGDGDPDDGDPDDDDPDDDDPDDGEPPLPDLGDDHSCAPLVSLASECGECLSESCCDAAAMCAEAEACECLVACKLAGGSPGVCKNECGAKPGDVPEVALLLACAELSCDDGC